MQVIGPLLVVALIGLVVTIAMAARRQRGDLQGLFREAAQQTGLTYLEEDDGSAEALAQGFDPSRFSRFTSSSLGRVRPQSLVHGAVREGKACLFSHATRRVEGEARQWFVAIVEADGGPAGGGLIECASREVRRVKEIGGRREVDFSDDPAFHEAFRTTAEDEAAARHRLDAKGRCAIMAAVAPLTFPVDLQIAGPRVALYAAARNYHPESAQDLAALLKAARQLAVALR